MQLKRDTDYALRLLLCAAKQTCGKTSGISLQDLSKETMVPTTIANRLCLKMTDANLLRAATHSGKTKRYLLGKEVMNKTLYDVICVVEEHNDIFAVFDRSTELFSSGGSYFQMVEQQLEGALNKVTLQHLIVKRKPLQRPDYITRSILSLCSRTISWKDEKNEMTDKELKRLTRVELIDIIYELQKQKDAADVRVAQLQEKLNQRELRIAQAGSIAEAAIGLNGVFEAAQAAADQYLHSIQTATSSIQRKLDAAEAQRKEIISSAEEEANRIVREGENKARAIVEAAERQSSEKWDCFEKRARELIAAHTELQRLIKRGG